MDSGKAYDVIIIGGGLAGLSAAILLGRKKYKVLLLEKESYPKHKVCGEYISMESKPFLISLGIPVDEMGLPVINKLQVTDTRGNELNTSLPQGGFGISRYKLDKALADLAAQAGATVLTKTKVDNVQWENGSFTVNAKDQVFTAKVACGTWGKRSNIDVKWQRSFLNENRGNALSNHVAVKYHIRYPWPRDMVGLHNFTDGYCGISQVEDDRCCICYLTTAASLQKSGDLKKLEQDVVMKNPTLNKVFSNAEFLYESPVTISQISFQKKEQVQEHVLLLGDAAGMITPLCGNGMSMALHSAKIAAALADNFLLGHITRDQMEQDYIKIWKHNFSTRTSLGRIVQNNFGKDITTSVFLKAVNFLPFLRNMLIKGTSGKPF